MTKLLTLSKLIVITSIFLSGAAIAQVITQDSGTELKTEQEKLFYFIGSTFGDNLLTLRLSDEELALVMRGVREAAYGNAVKLDAPIYGPRMQQLAAERSSAWLEEERPKAEEYLKRMATEDGAQTTASGLIFLTLSAGSGKQPTEESIVKVNYHGTLRDGTVFDSSVERNNPIEVPLKMVMPCWKEGIAMIQTGGSAKITCPAELAYQDRGMGNIPPGAAVTFEIELINVND